MPTAIFNHINLDRLIEMTERMPRVFPRKLAIGLVGTLGAGKTTMTQSLARALGVDRSDVTSPTFTLLSSYDCKVSMGPERLHHLDAYRVHDEDEFVELGIDELFDSDNCWVVIEWADKVRGIMPSEMLWITIEPEAASSDRTPARRITFESESPDIGRDLEQLTRELGDSRGLSNE